MTSDAVAQLLRQSERILDGAGGQALGNSARLAAFVARQAVESLVDVRLAEVGAQCPGATMRSRLAILKSLDDEGHAAQLEYTWNQLSACCHHHAYELAPTVGEVRTLCGTVADLLRLAA